jgi:8-oxo-dGTP pyrophosphatase MutT (NUDIX family)
MTTDLLEGLVAQAARFARSGAAPVEPRLSATVLLLRPAASGFEIYLQRRATSMAFASGRYVFPGGTVDPVDYAAPAAGRDWPARLGRPEQAAWAVVRAAVRELAEETGVRVTAGDLVPWSRWITPEFEPRRYDTSFFLAVLPEGQQPADVSGEADRTEWMRPAGAVARARSGEILLMPPTLVSLSELADHPSIDAALTAAVRRDAVTPILPSLDDVRELLDRFG